MARSTKTLIPTLGALAVLLSLTPMCRADSAAENAELGHIVQVLAQRNWEQARESAHRLAESLVRQSADPGQNRRTLGRAAAYEAIAEAALGLERAATWHWYVAQNLDPSVADMDLSAYGGAGERLRSYRLLPAAEQQPLTDVYDPEGNPGSFRHPKRTAVVYPQRPHALSEKDRFSHVVFVQVTIDEDGTLTQPLVMDAAFYPGLVYNAFEALRDWSYRPATVAGEPVPFRFVMPVIFSDDRPEQSAVFFGP